MVQTAIDKLKNKGANLTHFMTKNNRNQNCFKNKTSL